MLVIYTVGAAGQKMITATIHQLLKAADGRAAMKMATKFAGPIPRVGEYWEWAEDQADKITELTWLSPSHVDIWLVADDYSDDPRIPLADLLALRGDIWQVSWTKMTHDDG